MPHWNYEYVRFPAPDNRALGKRLIDAGADIIIGSHPHIYQGYEKYKSKYIFHSLGNFVFHSDVFRPISMVKDDTRINISFIVSVTLNGYSEYNTEIIPIYTDDNCVRPLEPEETVAFTKKMEKISSILNNEKMYKKYFYRDASGIAGQSEKMLKKLAAEQGMRNLLKRVIKVRKQDVKVKFFSLFKKNKFRIKEKVKTP